ncbi:hypothetical protein HGD80_03950 [Paulownia witches'-broom phytoplasma]|uniref:Uncharacterized protein n=1 Tax=Paulownia witches'-broom phytoplasma TaxID=39647 RepID=A0ABX8TP12_9MOLU|nr:hypothetical protein [Paulownia witches'-broom phytoplasma]QYC30900.1 hypothetical protein HGD80_03950 [Paulownia witches'-broom phytoplasma]GLH60965.1 hypothetical protein PAWBP_7030 [Paulownia witches'-broom phytoplasma]
MARNYRRSYFSKKSFRRNKLTLGNFFTYWILPTLGIVFPLIVYFASKGYLSIAK